MNFFCCCCGNAKSHKEDVWKKPGNDPYLARNVSFSKGHGGRIQRSRYGSYDNRTYEMTMSADARRLSRSLHMQARPSSTEPNTLKDSQKQSDAIFRRKYLGMLVEHVQALADILQYVPASKENDDSYPQSSISLTVEYRFSELQKVATTALNSLKQKQLLPNWISEFHPQFYMSLIQFAMSHWATINEKSEHELVRLLQKLPLHLQEKLITSTPFLILPFDCNSYFTGAIRTIINNAGGKKDLLHQTLIRNASEAIAYEVNLMAYYNSTQHANEHLGNKAAALDALLVALEVFENDTNIVARQNRIEPIVSEGIRLAERT